MDLQAMSNHELKQHAERVVADERKHVLASILTLREVMRRRLYLPWGYSSMYDYATRGLGLSENQAWSRLQIARASEFFPIVLDKLASGEAKLAQTAAAVGKLTEANSALVFEMMKGRSKRKFVAVLARITHDGRLLPGGQEAKTKLTFACTADQAEAYERLKALLISQGKVEDRSPEGVLAAIVKLGLRHADPVEKAKRAPAKTAAPVSSTVFPERVAPLGRYVPASVRHAVFLRDGGRCCYRASDGTPCMATVGLQVDHRVRMFCRGGGHRIDELQLLCKAHNPFCAELQLGREFMARKISPRIVPRCTS